MVRYPRQAIIAALALVAFGFFLLLSRSNYSVDQQPEQQLVRVPADESTPAASKDARLGFDEILVVTAGFHDWRAQGLKAAAERTGLAVTFLQQPSWTDKQKKAFHRGDKYESWSIPGSTGCWLGHLHALKHFLSTKQTTALILEDDADWDVEIKDQVIRAQYYLRKLTEPVTDSFWGTEWDVLYLGHCGDRFHYGTLKPMPPGLRAVHRSIRPVCTYGYAVTAKGAEKIINLSHDAKAIDTRMGRACKDGTMRCFTINPELIHHHIPAGKAPSEIQTKQDVSAQAWTPNILHSARCNLDRGEDELVSCSRSDG
ncbi:hypothetical protein KC340_g9708 [Hortaea werneckii]|nr:hypothetical protein KC342_g7280 [Hortaea werneckii]KAI7097725.1 hypothetical protein KC339_g9488 [Hortaea werneckii]KAI7208600.1 hypothetical protein KC365_g16005 [Hortaea werneckii]KAI7312941.1 hypothetical protein KC340_g9708 [Hortaea werneckii]KAI7379689.1 hypothetical protein KC328_g13187 [Hortaea werneckii]